MLCKFVQYTIIQKKQSCCAVYSKNDSTLCAAQSLRANYMWHRINKPSDVSWKKHTGAVLVNCQWNDAAMWSGQNIKNDFLSVFHICFVCRTQDHSNEEVQLGVTSQGLAVFQNHVKTNTFTWYCASHFSVFISALYLLIGWRRGAIGRVSDLWVRVPAGHAT